MKEMIVSQFEQQHFENSWMKNLKSEAMARFSLLGFPTLKEEEWKYTNVEPVTRLPFRFSSNDLTCPVGAIRESPLQKLVFINGCYSQEFSQVRNLPAGVFVGPLSEFIQKKPELVQKHLSHYANFQNQAFIALNTAFVQEGAFVYLPKGVVLEDPIEIYFISRSSKSFVTQPRNLIIAEAESQATLLEYYQGEEDVYFTNAVTEICAADSAVIEHVKIQEESEKAYHIFSLGVKQGQQSSVISHSISLGAALSRHNLASVLDAEGAECVMNGLYLASGNQHVDHHTVMDHVKPHCVSQELYKGILDGKARGVFNGKVIVRPNATKTNSSQSNKNLLLSDEAEIDTEPLLEIFNNDVKCSHGATTGRLDPKQIFYLRSRGISEVMARQMLTSAFASEVLEKLKLPALRDRLRKKILDALQKEAKGRLP